MAFPTTDPIALQITKRSMDDINKILSPIVAIAHNDNRRTILRLGSGGDEILIPETCAVALEIIVHQLCIYRTIVSILVKLERSNSIEGRIMFYVSLAKYITDVIDGFIGEVRQDGQKAQTSKWRSAHIDLHITLALNNSAFTPELQTTALKAIKRTWAQFKAKKTYKRIQGLTYKALHNEFCADGANMCGGPFDHKHSVDEMISNLMEQITKRPQAPGKTITQKPVGDKSSNEQNETPVAVHASESTDSASKSNQLHQNTRRKHRSSITARETSRKLSERDDESDSVLIAEIFERQEDAKKSPKGRKAPRKSKTTKGKAKATAKVKEKEKDVSQTMRKNSDDHEVDLSSGNEAVVVKSALVKTKGKKKAVPMVLVPDSGDDDLPMSTPGGSDIPKSMVPATSDSIGAAVSQRSTKGFRDDPILEFSDHDSDEDHAEIQDESDTLPNELSDWEAMQKTAFEQANTQVFLKLGAWMLVRFRQLTLLDVDSPLDPIVIARDPRTLMFDNHDEFLEALGMERLFSAMVHMESRPRFLSHLFHALGNIANTTDIGSSNPRLWPISSPPTVTPSMMSDMNIPWLSLTGDESDVANEFDGMALYDNEYDTIPPSHGEGTSAKRKRTFSLASPPKKDGGRGPSKRLKLSSYSSRLDPITLDPTQVTFSPDDANEDMLVTIPSDEVHGASDMDLIDTNDQPNIEMPDSPQELGDAASPIPSTNHATNMASASQAITDTSNEWFDDMTRPSA